MASAFASLLPALVALPRPVVHHLGPHEISLAGSSPQSCTHSLVSVFSDLGLDNATGSDEEIRVCDKHTPSLTSSRVRALSP